MRVFGVGLIGGKDDVINWESIAYVKKDARGRKKRATSSLFFVSIKDILYFPPPLPMQMGIFF